MTAEQLRNSILQEAVLGHLVPQNPVDEPASTLLERVRLARESLLREKKVKAKDIDSAPIQEDERTFELPAQWEFVRLNYVATIARGGSPRPIKEYLTDSPNGYNWIKIGDTEKGGKYINHTKERIKPEGLKKSRLIHKGDFLLTNSMSFGRPYISNIEGCIHDGWLVISPAFGEVFDKDYLYYVLSSPYVKDQFLGKVSGAVVQNLNSDKVATSVIPLPPLAEQQRIAAKLEELLPIVEQYGKAQTELDELNAALPARLRQSILQEAFKGKLTHADTTEWIEENLGKIADFLYGFPFQANMFNEEKNGKPIIRIRNIVPSWTRTYSTEICDEKYLITKGDMLVGMDGNFNVRFWKGEDAYLNQRVCRITAHVGKLHQKYLYYYLPVYLQELEENVSRTTVGHLSDKHLRNMPIPLPPLAEQQRIVAKIEELFAEIDKLK